MNFKNFSQEPFLKWIKQAKIVLNEAAEVEMQVTKINKQIAVENY